MPKLLYIKASPRGEASKSIAIADAYLAALRAKHPTLEVDVLDFGTERLPEFDGDEAAAKLAIITKQAPNQVHRSPKHSTANCCLRPFTALLARGDVVIE
jgi:FMN-dependent NADH-azoreductase